MAEWEVTISEIKDNGKKYKVTRRMPEMNVAETKLFDSIDEAKKQLELWLE
tara:strand:- start:297 stop:449 length:153 start_codon:yes stop_codon:yes gene_type:complete